MRGHRYLHDCRHRFSSGKVEEIIDSPELFSEDGKPTVLLIDGANVIEILEVRVFREEYVVKTPTHYDDYTALKTFDDPDKGEGYYDQDSDYKHDFTPYFTPGAELSNPIPTTLYRSFLHNRIQFLVYPPERFMVKMRVRYGDARQTYYSENDCPRCDGRGWYIDLVNEDGQFLIAQGSEHVVQDFLKELLSEAGSSMLDREAGSRLHTVVGSTEPDEYLEAQITEIVSETVEAYLNQQELVDTSDYAPEEILIDVLVARFERAPSNRRRWRIHLSFITQAGALLYVLRF